MQTKIRSVLVDTYSRRQTSNLKKKRDTDWSNTHQTSTKAGRNSLQKQSSSAGAFATRRKSCTDCGGVITYLVSIATVQKRASMNASSSSIMEVVKTMNFKVVAFRYPGDRELFA